MISLAMYEKIETEWPPAAANNRGPTDTELGGIGVAERICLDCSSPKIKARGLCDNCFHKRKRRNLPLPPRRGELPKPPCRVDGCDRSGPERGMCHKHYLRWHRARNGLPDWRESLEDPARAAGVLNRILSRVTVNEAGCWIMRGAAHGSQGYPSTSLRGTSCPAYAVMFWLINGPVPDGHEIDHVCHSNDLSCAGGPNCLHRQCVNPDHLEAVTPAENYRRGRHIQMTRARGARLKAEQAARTHCKRGHDQSIWSRTTKTRHRYCRLCNTENEKRRREARRAAAQSSPVPLCRGEAASGTGEQGRLL